MVHLLAVFAAAFAILPPSAHATDQTVLGKSFVVKDPAPGIDASLRSVVVLGKEPASDDTVVGDPIEDGATIEVIANGATPTHQVFTLPSGSSVTGSAGWKALGDLGYVYRDTAGTNGPVKTVVIKKTAMGLFLVKAVIKGGLGQGAQPHVTVVPPAPGTDGGMRLTIIEGDTYCVAFGGAAGGAVTNAPTKGTPNRVFKVVSTGATLTTEAGCPGPPTTTSTSSSTTSTSTSTSTTTTTSTSTTSSSTTTSTTSTSVTTTTALICDAAGYPTCAGTCPPQQVCVAAFTSIMKRLCVCVAEGAVCGTGVDPPCLGACPPGEACHVQVPTGACDGCGFP